MNGISTYTNENLVIKNIATVQADQKIILDIGSSVVNQFQSQNTSLLTGSVSNNILYLTPNPLIIKSVSNTSALIDITNNSGTLTIFDKTNSFASSIDATASNIIDASLLNNVITITDKANAYASSVSHSGSTFVSGTISNNILTLADKTNSYVNEVNNTSTLVNTSISGHTLNVSNNAYVSALTSSSNLIQLTTSGNSIAISDIGTVPTFSFDIDKNCQGLYKSAGSIYSEPTDADLLNAVVASSGSAYQPTTTLRSGDITLTYNSSNVLAFSQYSNYGHTGAAKTMNYYYQNGNRNIYLEMNVSLLSGKKYMISYSMPLYNGGVSITSYMSPAVPVSNSISQGGYSASPYTTATVDNGGTYTGFARFQFGTETIFPFIYSKKYCPQSIATCFISNGIVNHSHTFLYSPTIDQTLYLYLGCAPSSYYNLINLAYDTGSVSSNTFSGHAPYAWQLNLQAMEIG